MVDTPSSWFQTRPANDIGRADGGVLTYRGPSHDALIVFEQLGAIAFASR
jgi:hypothetical protein